MRSSCPWTSSQGPFCAQNNSPLPQGRVQIPSPFPAGSQASQGYLWAIEGKDNPCSLFIPWKRFQWPWDEMQPFTPPLVPKLSLSSFPAHSPQPWAWNAIQAFSFHTKQELISAEYLQSHPKISPSVFFFINSIYFLLEYKKQDGTYTSLILRLIYLKGWMLLYPAYPVTIKIIHSYKSHR